MKHPLTKTQSEIRNFIKSFWETEQRCPSLREIGAGKLNGKKLIEARKKQTVHTLIQYIIEKGWLIEYKFKGRTYWRLSD